MADGYCNGCKWLTPIVIDHKARDIICSVCGYVLEQYNDEKPEWLNFVCGDDSTDHCNGKSTNGCSSGSGGCSRRERRRLLREENSIEHADSAIESMGRSLRLTNKVKDCAKELFRKAREAKLCRFRNANAILSACVYLACREMSEPRTVNKIARASSGITRTKLIFQAILKMKEMFGVGARTPRAKDLAMKFCSNLGLDKVVTKAVLDTLEKCETCYIRSNRNSIMAAAIFMVAQLSETKKKFKEVARVTEVAQNSITKAYKDLCAIASDVIPSWYAKPEDLKNLYARVA